MGPNGVLELGAWFACAVAALLALRFFNLRARRTDPNHRMNVSLEVDANHPLRRWTQTACMLVTRDCDYGHLDRGEARRMLQRWWQVHGIRELHEQLDELRHCARDDNAWDLLRFLLVARLGAGAGWLDHADSWRLIAPVAQRLQRAYSSWIDMARAYIVARRQWQQLPLDGSRDGAAMRWITENLETLRRGLWTEVPYNLNLETP